MIRNRMSCCALLILAVSAGPVLTLCYSANEASPADPAYAMYAQCLKVEEEVASLHLRIAELEQLLIREDQKLANYQSVKATNDSILRSIGKEQQ